MVKLEGWQAGSICFIWCCSYAPHICKTDSLPGSLQAEDRGKAFGVLLFSGSMGGMIGSLYATNIGNTVQAP